MIILMLGIASRQLVVIMCLIPTKLQPSPVLGSFVIFIIQLANKSKCDRQTPTCSRSTSFFPSQCSLHIKSIKYPTICQEIVSPSVQYFDIFLSDYDQREKLGCGMFICRHPLKLQNAWNINYDSTNAEKQWARSATTWISLSLLSSSCT